MRKLWGAVVHWRRGHDSVKGQLGVHARIEAELENLSTATAELRGLVAELREEESIGNA